MHMREISAYECNRPSRVDMSSFIGIHSQAAPLHLPPAAAPWSETTMTTTTTTITIYAPSAPEEEDFSSRETGWASNGMYEPLPSSTGIARPPVPYVPSLLHCLCTKPSGEATAPASSGSDSSIHHLCHHDNFPLIFSTTSPPFALASAATVSACAAIDCTPSFASDIADFACASREASRPPMLHIEKKSMSARAHVALRLYGDQWYGKVVDSLPVAVPPVSLRDLRVEVDEMACEEEIVLGLDGQSVAHEGCGVDG
jgi:hypothetical protein